MGLRRRRKSMHKPKLNHELSYERVIARAYPSGRQDGAPGRPGFAYTERHLKCVWFATELRPVDLRTERGEQVIVERPGRWNLEKGPDFLQAALLVGPERRRMVGDVEVHVHPADWQRHGHADDPAYGRVIGHITYFSGRLPEPALPPGAVQIALNESLLNNPCFSFEAIDLTAYPFASRQPRTPCSKLMSRWDPDKVAALLESAGMIRMERKAGPIAAAVEQKGEDQVLYEEIMSALGYKHNRMPFRRLAEIVPLDLLREECGLNATAAYALLAGVAGLLPAGADMRWDDETRRFVRKLWEYWWKQQAEWSANIMPREVWALSSVRPQNHPRRRLMAAAVLFTGKKTLSAQLSGLNAENARQWIGQALALIQCPADAFWRRHLAMGVNSKPADIALVGRRRAAAVVSNVLIPLQIGLHRLKFQPAELAHCMPAEEDNAVIRQMAFNLLGPDHNPALYNSGLRQQGLIRIFHDFCLGDRSNCAECALARMIKNT